MTALALARTLFERLDAGAIDYLHWKSNQHLEEALAGETDLDLLVRESQAAELRACLEELGFVEMLLPRHQWFPGRSAFLGFDGETGRLVHLDVHALLVLGEQLVKNHRLPIEDWLFEGSQVLDGVRVPVVEKEFVVFYIRLMMKTTTRQRLKSSIKGGSPFPRNIRDELAWFTERVSPGVLGEAATSAGLGLTAPELAEFLDRAQEGRFSSRYLRDGKQSLLERLRSFEWDARSRARYKKASRRLRSSRPFRKLGLGLPLKRLIGRGPVIAIVGADGSGKTRLSRDLEHWLRWKLSVRHVYFGQPKTGFGFRALNKAAGTLHRRGTSWFDSILEHTARWADTTKWLVLAGGGAGWRHQQGGRVAMARS